jgi:hypothetical protein
VIAGCWDTKVAVSLELGLATRAARRARALTGGGWGWATSGNCETFLGAGVPRAQADALPAFHVLGWECDRADVRFAAAAVFAVLTG